MKRVSWVLIFFMSSDVSYLYTNSYFLENTPFLTSPIVLLSPSIHFLFFLSNSFKPFLPSLFLSAASLVSSSYTVYPSSYDPKPFWYAPLFPNSFSTAFSVPAPSKYLHLTSGIPSSEFLGHSKHSYFVLLLDHTYCRSSDTLLLNRATVFERDSSRLSAVWVSTLSMI